MIFKINCFICESYCTERFSFVVRIVSQIYLIHKHTLFFWVVQSDFWVSEWLSVTVKFNTIFVLCQGLF